MRYINFFLRTNAKENEDYCFLILFTSMGYPVFVCEAAGWLEKGQNAFFKDG